MRTFLKRGFKGYGHLLGAVKPGISGGSAGSGRRGRGRFHTISLVKIVKKPGPGK